MSSEEKLYPNDYEANLDHRLKVMIRTRNKPEAMALVKDRCKNDILFWINTFGMTYNPRKTPAVIPFVTYDYQDKFILKLVDAIENQKDILVDKSRDMGVSWCVITVFTWYWQFKGEGKDFLCGSRKEQYVDKIGDMATLMQKIRFLIANQPKWMLPRGYKEKDHATYMKIKNPDTGSIITGEATNENFSRGGRQLAILFDEFAFWDVDTSAWRSSADTSNCRIAVSTPKGFNNHFAKLRHSKSIQVQSLHWKLHPEKNEDWYQGERARRNHDPVEIAQELDISYEGSESGVLFEWEELNKAKMFESALSLDRIVMTIDPSTTGKDAAVLYINNNGAIVLKKKFKHLGTDPIAAGKILAAESVLLIKKHHVQVVMSDMIGNDILTLISMLLGESSKVKIVPFKSSKKAHDEAKYYNARAELYDQAASSMKSGNLQVDDDYTLMKQLNATHYETKNDRMIIIPKERIKEIVGESPNEADAWALIPEALKLTHSRREVEYQETFRKRQEHVLVGVGEEYGGWEDTEGGF